MYVMISKCDSPGIKFIGKIFDLLRCSQVKLMKKVVITHTCVQTSADLKNDFIVLKKYFDPTYVSDLDLMCHCQHPPSPIKI